MFVTFLTAVKKDYELKVAFMATTRVNIWNFISFLRRKINKSAAIQSLSRRDLRTDRIGNLLFPFISVNGFLNHFRVSSKIK